MISVQIFAILPNIILIFSDFYVITQMCSFMNDTFFHGFMGLRNMIVVLFYLFFGKIL